VGAAALYQVLRRWLPPRTTEHADGHGSGVGQLSGAGKAGVVGPVSAGGHD
jgi:hypothetical protein